MMHTAITTTCNTVWRFCAVNLMVLALTALGGIVLGLGPAIAASYWAMSHKDMPLDQLAKGMLAEWRAEFVRSNLVMVPFGILVWAALQPQIAGMVSLTSAVLILIFTLEVTISALFAVSISRASMWETAINAGLLIAARPLRFLIATLALPALVLVATWQPLLGLYGLFSIHAAIVVGLMGSMRDPMNRPLAAPSTALEVQS